MVKPKVKRWEPVVISQLDSIPLPPELILSVINVESRGNPGLVNPKSGASGLMQVMPGTLLDWNSRNGKSYTVSDMRSEDENSAQKQIEVGIGVLSHYWKRAYKYLSGRMESVPIDLLARVADLFYVAGPGATMKRLDKMPAVTWSGIKQQFPKWNALPHPNNVFKEPIAFNVDEIGTWIEGPIDKIGVITKDPKSGFAIGVLILMVSYWLMKKGK